MLLQPHLPSLNVFNKAIAKAEQIILASHCLSCYIPFKPSPMFGLPTYAEWQDMAYPDSLTIRVPCRKCGAQSKVIVRFRTYR